MAYMEHFGAVPGMVDGDVPKSWRHFGLGMRWLDVEQSRRTLMIHQATLMAQVAPDDRKEWHQQHSVAARWWKP